MPVVLGVDGGSSKTHAALVDETGALLGFGRAGVANQNTNGLESALAQIESAVRMALREAQLSTQQVQLGYFCLAGADFAEDFLMLRTRLEQILGLAGRVVVKNDTAAGLRSGLSRPWGVVVICGTGINAAGRGRDGREISLPALGSLSGDWGGGGTLGVEVIGAVMRAWDGRGRETLLTPIVLDALQFTNEEELLAALYHDRVSRDQKLALTPLLFVAAQAGDKVARELVKRLGTEVGITAGAFLRRLDLSETDAEVVLAGSVFKGRGPLLIDTVRKVVHKSAPRAQIVRPKLEPIGGALLLALEAANLPVTRELSRRLEVSPLAISADPEA